jgi:hypothetical protein
LICLVLSLNPRNPGLGCNLLPPMERRTRIAMPFCQRCIVAFVVVLAALADGSVSPHMRNDMSIRLHHPCLSFSFAASPFERAVLWEHRNAVCLQSGSSSFAGLIAPSFSHNTPRCAQSCVRRHAELHQIGTLQLRSMDRVSREVSRTQKRRPWKDSG